MNLIRSRIIDNEFPNKKVGEMKKNKTQITEWNVLDYLRTEKDIANYLQAALEENDVEFFLVALGDVAKARSINKIAKEIGVGRESLYKSLSGTRRPNVETVFKAIDALGLKVNFVPKNSNQQLKAAVA